MTSLLLLLACRSAPVVDEGTRPVLDDRDPPVVDTAPVEPGPLVVLVSLDGVHPDYLDRAETPTLDRIAAEGVSASWLTPITPTKTFPNHYTLVTGLYAENHGIVDNSFYDPESGSYFTMSATEDHWWGGEPIWVTAEKQGRIASTCFWPGSASEIAGYRPTDWLPYDGSMSHAARVAQVLDWLDRPVASRSNLVTLYFSDPDSAGHADGPDADSVVEALESVDTALASLVAGLESRGLYQDADVVIVSDHGMSQLSPERLEAMPDVSPWVDYAQAYSPFGRFDVPAENVAPMLEALSEGEHYTCYAREDTPESWHYRDNERISDVLCVAEDGWTLGTEDWLAERGDSYTGGTHGFSVEDASMRAVFLARGPHFASGGVEVDAFEAVEVYNLLATALEIEPADNDGDLGRVPGVLAGD